MRTTSAPTSAPIHSMAVRAPHMPSQETGLVKPLAAQPKRSNTGQGYNFPHGGVAGPCEWRAGKTASYVCMALQFWSSSRDQPPRTIPPGERGWSRQSTGPRGGVSHPSRCTVGSHRLQQLDMVGQQRRTKRLMRKSTQVTSNRAVPETVHPGPPGHAGTTRTQRCNPGCQHFFPLEARRPPTIIRADTAQKLVMRTLAYPALFACLERSGAHVRGAPTGQVGPALVSITVEVSKGRPRNQHPGDPFTAARGNLPKPAPGCWFRSTPSGTPWAYPGLPPLYYYPGPYLLRGRAPQSRQANKP